MKKTLSIFLFLTFLFSATSSFAQNDLNDEKGKLIINKSIEAHGGELYDTANYSFVFRGKKYAFNHANGYSYSVEYSDSEGKKITDSLNNGKLTKYVNDQPVTLSEINTRKYEGALNSVIYFANLPYKLNDKAVNKKFMGTDIIESENYDLVKVTFNKEGGGVDHEDEFLYWINTKTFKVDYLAYKYHVNGGGARFRSFYNRRNIDGITFQDYINWKGSLDIPLKDMGKLFEQKKLKELSRIEISEIVNLK